MAIILFNNSVFMIYLVQLIKIYLHTENNREMFNKNTWYFGVYFIFMKLYERKYHFRIQG